MCDKTGDPYLGMLLHVEFLAYQMWHESSYMFLWCWVCSCIRLSHQMCERFWRWHKKGSSGNTVSMYMKCDLRQWWRCFLCRHQLYVHVITVFKRICREKGWKSFIINTKTRTGESFHNSKKYDESSEFLGLLI